MVHNGKRVRCSIIESRLLAHCPTTDVAPGFDIPRQKPSSDFQIKCLRFGLCITWFCAYVPRRLPLHPLCDLFAFVVGPSLG